MYKKTFIPLMSLLLLVLTTIFAQSAYARDDRAVVRAILDKIGRKDDAVEDVAQFSRDDRVIQLNLNRRGISGAPITEFPTEVFQLTQLRGLLLRGNRLTSIPHEIGNMTELIELNLADNNGLGSLPPSIGNLPNLQKLDVRYCGLSTLPASFGNLKRLELLQMWGNGLTELPHSILEMTGLKELYLSHNNLTTLPADITKLPLRYIDTQMNTLCDLPSAIDTWLRSKELQYKEHQRCDNVQHF